MLSGNGTNDRYSRIGDITGVLQAMEDDKAAFARALAARAVRR